MDQLVIGCLVRAIHVCGRFLQWVVGWLQVAFSKPGTHPCPPDTLNHAKWGEHRYITVHKLKLHYVTKGSSDKPLMLFLHGLPDFWYSWRHQLHDFSKDYWTVAVDLPGFGRSEKPIYGITYKLNNLALLVKQFVLDVGKSDCIVVGSEAGALLGWHIVNQCPEIVSKYVMLGMPPVGVLQELYVRHELPLKLLLRWTLYKHCGSICLHLARAADYAYFDRLLGANAKPQDLEAYKYTFAQPQALERAMEAFEENFNDFLLPDELDFRARESSTVPGLFIFGDTDCLIDDDSVLGMLLNIYRPLETRFVPRAGTLMHQTDPGAVNKIIRDFLREDGYPVPQLNQPERKVIVKEVCNNCYTKQHTASDRTDDHHRECAENCDGREHLANLTTTLRLPICS